MYDKCRSYTRKSGQSGSGVTPPPDVVSSDELDGNREAPDVESFPTAATAAIVAHHLRKVSEQVQLGVLHIVEPTSAGDVGVHQFFSDHVADRPRVDVDGVMGGTADDNLRRQPEVVVDAPLAALLHGEVCVNPPPISADVVVGRHAAGTERGSLGHGGLHLDADGSATERAVLLVGQLHRDVLARLCFVNGR